MTDKNNFIVTLKFFLAISMVIGHCLIFGSFYWGEAIKIHGVMLEYIFRSISISVVGCLPAMASFVWVLQSNGKGFGLQEAKKVLIFLTGAEVFKSLILYKSISGIFHFDVLLLIGLSLYLIEKFWNNRKWVLVILFAILFFINPFFIYARLGFAIKNFSFFIQNKTSINSIVIPLLIGTFGTFLFKKYSHKKMWIKLTLMTLFSLGVIKLFIWDLSSLGNLYNFFNFPLGALVGVYKALHVWPLLVWLPLLILSAFFGWFFALKRQKVIYDLLIIALSIVYLLFYYIEVFRESFYWQMNRSVMGNESVFFIDSLRMMAHAATFVILVYVFYLVNKIYSLSRFEFARLSSRWLLVFYLVSYLFPDSFAGVFGRNFDFIPGISLMFLVTLLLCFLVSFFLDIVFLRLKFNVKLEKVK